MYIYENMLIKYKELTLSRVLYVDKVDGFLVAVDIKEDKWPYMCSISKIIEDLKEKRSEVIEDTFIRIVNEENISTAEKEKRESSWQVVKFILSKTEGVEIYVSKYRTPIIKEATKVFGLSYNTIKSYMVKYWKHGKIKNGLLANYNNSGAKGRDRRAGTIKRGRPALGGRAGVNINEDIKKMFMKGLNKYYYTNKQNNLKTVYELIIRDNFVQEYIEEKGEKVPILKNISEIPNYGQFFYWFNRLNSTKKEITKRYGERIYNQQYRTIIGSSTQEAELGPGVLWQIDSTIFDIYIVSSLNRNKILLRPVLYLCIDVYSRLIVGVHLTLESFNSYSGVMLALINAMTSKVEYCKKYGIEITDEEFPFCTPQTILADRGELVNKQIETAIENLGISIQQSPAYRADYKGIIEQSFHLMNLKVKPFTDGVVVNGKNKIDRGEMDYRLRGTLTLEELTKIILKSIIFHNNSHVLSEEVSREMLFEESIEKIPLKIWNYGVENKKGLLRKLPADVIKTNLLPSETAKLTSRGVLFRKMLYASDYTLKEGWFSNARVKGNSSVQISYNPLDLSTIHFIEDGGKTFHTLTLVEHLKKYSNKSEYEIEEYFSQEKELNEKAKEKELSNKIKLFNEIESIVANARGEAVDSKDNTLSNRKRLSGIKENNRAEKELYRERLVFSKNENIEVDMVEENNENNENMEYKETELEIFGNVQEEYWGDSYE
ncbi:Mu transposase C-terminal domain-containing protein [Clostridium estertheticum]|uniref:DDE-type integrase/transposase/recombinase n=1 Tax=Clostridium estertheticum TaxID=238834 RepID=A0A7Y3WUL0_9CLOT|nr:Mu transposase C-terminal domain-containing protein [Clostridium estertheticum]NNU78120.1 DDE-type integrase/transposase/recombinase [Clostridium estertheticum]WBL47768.1 transposase family protein [Clostridium estertheticum]